MSGTKRDYYEVLGVERGATVEDIERAYRKLARQHHPDRNIGDSTAEVKFKEVTEAHEILVNVEKRERYDRYGHAGMDPNDTGFGPAGSSFTDIVSDLFTLSWAAAAADNGAATAKCGNDRRVFSTSNCKRPSARFARAFPFAGLRSARNAAAGGPNRASE